VRVLAVSFDEVTYVERFVFCINQRLRIVLLVFFIHSSITLDIIAYIKIPIYRERKLLKRIFCILLFAKLFLLKKTNNSVDKVKIN
jgi:hypothetical protein